MFTGTKFTSMLPIHRDVALPLHHHPHLAFST
jgi:hypothetical protein